MDKNELEKVDIVEEDTVEQDFAPEVLEANTTDWKAEALKLKGIAKRRATKLEKLKANLAKPQVELKPQDKIENKQLDNGLLQKTYLRAAGITAEDEVELALETSKKWGTDIDKLVDDPDFRIKLERLRTSKANVKATTGIRGGSGSSDVKNTPEFYLSRGTPPTKEEVSDRKTRVKIARAFMSNSKDSKKFYND